MIRECIHCKKSRGLGSDVWCSDILMNLICVKQNAHILK